MNGNWMQLIFVFLVFGGGAIQWTMRKLGEQAAQRKAQQDVARRRTELLRTGRTTEQPEAQAQPSPGVDLDSIAARRQRQLEELRRRQQAARRPTNTPQARPPSRPQPQQARPPKSQQPQQPRSHHVAKDTKPVLPSAADRKPTKPGEHSTLGVLDHSKKHLQKSHGHSAKTGGEVLSEQLARESRQAAAQKKAKRKTDRASSSAGLVPQTPREWRQAIIASEILAKPLSERSAEQ